MASGRDPEAIDLEPILHQILQMQADAGLRPGTSLSETLDRLLWVEPNAQVDAPTLQCSVCRRAFRGKQERDKHVRTYLPHFFFCPFEGCPMRTDRAYHLRMHWVAIHAEFGEAPRPEDCKIYNPDPLVQSVISGESSIELVIAIALQAVKVRAPVLEKVGIWGDEWGRRQRIPHGASWDSSSFFPFLSHRLSRPGHRNEPWHGEEFRHV